MDDPKLLKSQINSLKRLLEVQEETVLEQMDQLDKALRRNKLILNSAGEGIYGLDVQGNTTFVNPAGARMVGYTPEEMIGKPQHALIHHTFPDGTPYPREQCNIYLAFKTGKTCQENKEVFWRKDGSCFPVEYVSTPIYEGAKIVGAVVTFKDISERKETEIRLQRETDIISLLQTIGDKANKDLPVKEVLIYAMEQICGLMGWTVGHVYLLSSPDSEILEPTGYWYSPDLSRYAEFKRVTDSTTFQPGMGLPGRVMESKKVAWISNVQMDDNFPRNKRSNNLLVKGGFALPILIQREVAGVLEFFSEEIFQPESSDRDRVFQDALSQIGTQLGRVLERQRSQEETLRAKEIAESANQAKTNFLSNMSHEIRTPLNAILGYTQILRKNESLDAETRDALKTIQSSGSNLLNLINEILDLSKIEAGKVELHPVDFDLYELIDGLSRMFELRCSEKAIEWIVSGVNQSCIVYGDEGKIRQVLVNLIGNAVKFTDSGKVELKITTLGGDEYQFDVTDTGQGIPKNHQQVIFEPFRQEDEGIKKGGTGLGLAISQKQLQLMGADLDLESELGKGSRFYFKIHLPQSSKTELEKAEDFDNAVRLSAGCHVKALVVDDIKENRDVLRLFLEHIGVEVSCAENGLEGLEAVRKDPPDIIFMDMRMPVMDGEEAINKIVEEHGRDRFKIAVITASIFGFQEGKFKDLPFDDFLSKPFRDEQIFSCLKKLLNVDFEYKDESELESPAECFDLSDISLPEDLLNRLKIAAETYSITELEKGLAELPPETEGVDQLKTKIDGLLKSYNMAGILELLQDVSHSS
ncbi:MAG: PAS domain S-box protein [Candidatus Nitrohelix vancouverensis]|uniref:histidine kinase n=1 Tax=Candidatus Nitrohelix vancouverensis TaxID=2705534 RepID=A0A7T0C5B0_9BACT|nr:MAG: PAS domain S-box protein [Candidatus Nitrohelix vancouverensis]